MIDDIFLGSTIGGHEEVYLPAEVRETHMHVLGVSRRGKSKFLEHLIRQDILNGNGLCLIDPHGFLYDEIVQWCAVWGIDQTRKIALLNPSEEGWTFGFNPLAVGEGIELSFCVDAMVNAVAQVWGGEDLNKTPTLKRCLRAIFMVLAERGLTLYEALDLANERDPHGVREFITREIDDETYGEQWGSWNDLAKREFRDFFMSTQNRLMEFVSAGIVRLILGQQEHVIDWRKCMDDGDVILVNLARKGRLSHENARLLGTLIVNDLFVKAQTRPEGSRPFYVYIDECSRYINEDIGYILNEGAKFGLHLILAHQHLSQLKKEAGEHVYRDVMTSAQTKVVFGGLEYDDARIMVENVFMGEFNLQESKPIFERPQVTGHTRGWMRGFSQGKTHGTNQSSTIAHADAYHLGETESESESVQTSEGSGISCRYKAPNSGFADEGESSSHSSSRGSQTARSRTEGRSYTDSESETQGESFAETESASVSEQLVPTFEKLPTQAYSLEEQIYRAMVVMVNQPRREAILKFPSQPSIRIRVPDVEGYKPDNQWSNSFKKRVLEATDFTQPTEVVEYAINRRTLELRQKAQDLLNPPEPESYLEG